MSAQPMSVKRKWSNEFSFYFERLIIYWSLRVNVTQQQVNIILQNRSDGRPSLIKMSHDCTIANQWKMTGNSILLQLLNQNGHPQCIHILLIVVNNDVHTETPMVLQCTKFVEEWLLNFYFVFLLNSRGMWSCPSRWPCGPNRTFANGWRNTVLISTRSTATPSNSTTSQVFSFGTCTYLCSGCHGRLSSCFLQ